MPAAAGIQNATHFADFTPRAMPAAAGIQNATHFADFTPRAMPAAAEEAIAFSQIYAKSCARGSRDSKCNAFC